MSNQAATLQDDWRNYRDKVYPKGIPAVQNKETHQAFFAGALCYSQQIDAIANLPDDQIAAALEKLKREVWEVNSNRAHLAQARN